jgi:hypothetical protein
MADAGCARFLRGLGDAGARRARAGTYTTRAPRSDARRAGPADARVGRARQRACVGTYNDRRFGKAGWGASAPGGAAQDVLHSSR